ncbi:hypothetical protein Tco_0844401 [Tanacetum coccineum]
MQHISTLEGDCLDVEERLHDVEVEGGYTISLSDEEIQLDEAARLGRGAVNIGNLDAPPATKQTKQIQSHRACEKRWLRGSTPIPQFRDKVHGISKPLLERLVLVWSLLRNIRQKNIKLNGENLGPSRRGGGSKNDMFVNHFSS